MNVESWDASGLPFDLESQIGTIQDIEEAYPGVYFITSRKDDCILSKDYFAVLETADIFPKVRAYGQELPGLHLYPADIPDSGWCIVMYETGKLLAGKGLSLPGGESLRSFTMIAMENHPEYFGKYPVPLYTPRGYTLRHRELGNGIYWIETDQCVEVLAVCYSVWHAEFSKVVQQMGEQTVFDQQNGIQDTLGYLFFSGASVGAALYELIAVRPQWDGILINKLALMNSIWKQLPNYAVLSNWWEQKVVYTIHTLSKEILGVDEKPQLDTDRLVRIFPEAGEEFLLFQ